MKKIFYLVALFAAVMFTACDGSSVQTPDGDKTKLWPAGKKGSNLWGFMDKKGNLEIAAKYDAVYGFSCGWAMVKEDGEYQFIDKSAKNKHSVDNEEKVDYYFFYNHCRFKDGIYRGMWDKDFAVVIPADYVILGRPTADKLVYFSEDKNDEEGYGYLDMKGKVAIEPQWYDAYNFVDGMAVVMVKKGKDSDVSYKYGIINTKGEYIVEPQKNSLYSMGENRFAMRKSNGKFVLCDKNLEELSGSYDDMEPFCCGLSLVEKEEKGYGFIDKNGQEIVSCKYMYAEEYSDDLTFVVKDADSKVEVLDKKGESILKLKEGEGPYSSFHNGLALIGNYDSDANEYNYRYIDKNGETVYKWTPGDEDDDDDDDDDDAPARWRKANRRSIMQSEAAVLFDNYERAMQYIK